MIDVDDRNEWKECIDIGGVRLPTGYFFGASAATGDLSGRSQLKADVILFGFTSQHMNGYRLSPPQIIMTSSPWSFTSWWWSTPLRRRTWTGPKSSPASASSSPLKVGQDFRWRTFSVLYGNQSFRNFNIRSSCLLTVELGSMTQTLYHWITVSLI